MVYLEYRQLVQDREEKGDLNALTVSEDYVVENEERTDA